MTQSATRAIAIERVTKTFGKHVAVDDLSLEVPRGSVYGFIGPNGSGKSTTLRMIMNILLPDSGSIEVLGERGTRAARAVRDRVSYLPEERGLYKKMTVRRLLRYYGQLKGKSRRWLDGEIVRWLERLELGAWADKQVEALSKGMSQKVQFIAAVITEPELVILDEPFSGLDPVNAAGMRDAIVDLRKRGTTVVFSTHDMSTAEKMCDRIFMIYRGQKVLDGTLDEILGAEAGGTIRVRTEAGPSALEGLVEPAAVADHGQLQEVQLSGGDPQAFLRALSARTAVYHFELARPSLNDIFVRIAKPGAEGEAILHE